MSSDSSDNPGVVIWPPLLALITLLAGLALDWLAPLGGLVRVPLVPRVVVAVIVGAPGCVMALRAKGVFDRAGTNVEPWKPALNLATGGIYTRMRNPMYVGLGLITLAVAVGAASDWTIPLMIPAALVLHHGVMLREERYLEAKFGDDYRHFKQSVPRYGGPF